MLSAIWCAMFHKRFKHQVRAEGDWKVIRCDKCDMTWAEPRL